MKMTKISVTLAMLGLSAVAFAGMPGNQVVAPSGVNLIAPDSVGVWSLGLEAMYVQQTNNQFNYGQLTTVSGTSPNQFYDRDNKNVGDNWEWGGTVDLTYLFPGSSRDVKLAWTHLFSDTDTGHTTPGTGQYFQSSFAVPAFGPANPLAFNTFSSLDGGTAKGSAKTNYDAVDLVFGQWIKIGDRLDLHPFGGLRWAQVDSTFKGTYNVNASSFFPDLFSLSGGGTSYNKLTSNFDGIGPRAGFDTAVHLGAGFSIVGTFAGSLLVGSLSSKINNSTSFTYTSTDPLFPGTTANSGYSVEGSNDGVAVVPELDARLGLDYMYAFTPSTSMNIQLGYQVVNYFDVTAADFQGQAGSTSTLVPTEKLATSGVIPNTTSSRQNWGYQGPYVRLQLNIA